MNALRMLSRLFAAVGLGLLIGAFFAYDSASTFADGAARADGTVVELAEVVDSDGVTYYPVVRFLTGDQEEVIFQASVGSSPPSYDVGEPVGVLYDPADPNDAAIEGFWSQYLLTVILGGLGAIFLAIGLGMMLSRVASRRRREALEATGQRITARLTGVELNERLEVNGRNPWRVTAQWVDPESGQVHVFRSENLWEDPTEHLTGDTIDVLVDPTNPKRYAVIVEPTRTEAAETS